VSGGHRATLGLRAAVHVRSSTEIRTRILVVEGELQPVLFLADGGYADVSLFADRSDLLRLRDALNVLVSELDERSAVLESAADSAA
jgi:hypothetical protein